MSPLQVEGLEKRMGSFQLGPLSTSLPTEARRIRVEGPNGSGKSTLLALLAGFVAPDAGRIRMDGTDVGGSPPERRNVAFVFPEPALFPALSVRANLRFSNRARDRDSSREDRIVERLRLRPFLARRPPALSLGERRRVEVGRALLSRPRFLLLDEPFGGLDGMWIDETARLLDETSRDEGVRIVCVTHGARLPIAWDATLTLSEGRLVTAA